MPDQDAIDSPASAATLAYADEITQSGIRVERQAGLVRVIVPPQWKWWPVSTAMIGYLIAICLSSAMFVGASLAALHQRQYDLLVPAAEYGIIASILVYVAASRLTRWRVLDVTPDRLVRNQLTFGRMRQVGSWPRGRVVEIKYSQISGKLVLRVSGQDMREIALTPSVAANHYIVDALNAALIELPHSSLPHGAETARADAERAQRTTSTSAASVITALMVVGVLLIPLGRIGLLAGLGMIALATAVAGIRGGMQQNKFWT